MIRVKTQTGTLFALRIIGARPATNTERIAHGRTDARNPAQITEERLGTVVRTAKLPNHFDVVGCCCGGSSHCCTNVHSDHIGRRDKCLPVHSGSRIVPVRRLGY